MASQEQREALRIRKQIIIFIGPEGSGKTTQAKRLAEELDKPYITTGDLIRAIAWDDTDPRYKDHPLKAACQAMFANHTYLAGHLLIEILKERLSQPDTSGGVVIDGSMRTIDETLATKAMLQSIGLNYPMIVICLVCPRETSLERLVTGPNARRRSDDTEEGVNRRLEKYNFGLPERIALIKEFDNCYLHTIDATAGIEETYSKVLDVLW